jgi:hypothetical protein
MRAALLDWAAVVQTTAERVGTRPLPRRHDRPGRLDSAGFIGHMFRHQEAVRGSAATRSATAAMTCPALGVMFAPHSQTASNSPSPYGRASTSAACQLLVDASGLWRPYQHRQGSAQFHKTRKLGVTYFDSSEGFRDYFKTNYGPTISAYPGGWSVRRQQDQVTSRDHTCSTRSPSSSRR